MKYNIDLYIKIESITNENTVNNLTNINLHQNKGLPIPYQLSLNNVLI